MAYVLKFVENLRSRINKKKENKNENNEINNEKILKNIITGEEILMAKKYWLQEVQNVKEKPIGELLLFEGVYRWKGRLGNAPLPFTTKHPIWLPSNHYFIELLIKEAHEKVLHNGQRETLNELSVSRCHLGSEFFFWT